MRGLTKEVVIGEKVYIVRELTVLEIRNWIGSLDASSIDVVDELLSDGVQLSAVRAMADISRDDMDAMVPSAIDKLVEAAKSVNPRFFAMVDRVLAASRLQKLAPS